MHMGFSKPSGDNLRVHGAKKKPQKTGPRSYNSYFEGYTEFYETDSRGKRKKRYIYTDPYYRQDLTKKQRIGVKIAYSAAYLLAAVLFIYAALQPYVSVILWYVQGLTLILMAWLLYILAAYYIPTKADLTAYLYKKSSGPLRKVSLAAAIANIVLAGVLLLCLVVDSLVVQGLPAVIAYLVAGGVILLMHLTEKRIKYIRAENRNTAPADGYKIINDNARPSERSDAVEVEMPE